MELVETRQVDEVLVCKLDRLTRSLTARAEIYAAFTAKGAPILRALDDGIDMSTASGRQMFDFLGAMATGERERIRERINDGLNARRDLGLYVGQSPWGLRSTRTGSGVEIDPELQPEVEAVLQIIREERTITAAAKRIAAELGISRSRSVWRSWLNSPQISGSLPNGSKDRGVPQRQYSSVKYGAFESYLSPVEHQELLNKFQNPKRGPRSHSPEHPTRGRVICGYCGKPLQRRLDDKKQPRWLICSNIHCEVGRRSVSMPDATEYLLRAVHHFGILDLERRAIHQEMARSKRKPHPRETKLEAAIQTLKQMDPELVRDSLEKAEQELASLQQQAHVNSSLASLNSERVVQLIGFLTRFWLSDEQDPKAWERLVDLVKLVPVVITTKRDETRTFGGKPVVVLDRAYLNKGTDREESIAVDRLPPIQAKGGVVKLREIGAAARAVPLTKPPSVIGKEPD